MIEALKLSAISMKDEKMGLSKVRKKCPVDTDQQTPTQLGNTWNTFIKSLIFNLATHENFPSK